MKIVVCIKQVPDTAEVKLDPKTNTLIREGVPSIINHDDKAGLETALQIREQVGGTVSVVCMGPPQADIAQREALAMGADEAYLLSAREFGGSDTYATATIIATALRKIGFDLVITGRQAIDGDTAQVGPQIAEQLHIPQVSYAEELKTEGDSVIVKRQFEDQAHMLKVKTPCLITADEAIKWGIADELTDAVATVAVARDVRPAAVSKITAALTYRVPFSVSSAAGSTRKRYDDYTRDELLDMSERDPKRFRELLNEKYTG